MTLANKFLSFSSALLDRSMVLITSVLHVSDFGLIINGFDSIGDECGKKSVITNVLRMKFIPMIKYKNLERLRNFTISIDFRK
jgi:hypothetical protein